VSDLICVVEAVCVSTPGVRVAKVPVEEAFIGPHGLVGDRHEAEFRRLRTGGHGPNRRQWSAVSSEEVAAVCSDIGVTLFAIGALGENLRLSGLSLAELPDGAVLELPSGARLRVEKQNQPCLPAAKELAPVYGDAAGRDFVRRATNRRGVVGSVLEVGVVRPGDVVRVTLVEAAVAP
jgi:MOSC domain-containing protein YiiM